MIFPEEPYRFKYINLVEIFRLSLAFRSDVRPYSLFRSGLSPKSSTRTVANPTGAACTSLLPPRLHGAKTV